MHIRILVFLGLLGGVLFVLGFQQKGPTNDQVRPVWTIDSLKPAIDGVRRIIRGGEPEKGFKILDSIRRSAALRHDTLQAFVHHRAGVFYSVDMNDYENAIVQQGKALALRKKHFPPSHPEIIRGHTYMGKYYRLLPNEYKLDSSLWHIQQSLMLNRERETPTSMLGRSYLELSKVSIRLRDFEGAGDALRLSVSFFNNNRDFENLALAYNDLSSLYSLDLQQPDSALHYSDFALEACDSIPSQSRRYVMMGACYLNKAIAWQVKEKYSNALQVYEKALDQYNLLGESYQYRVRQIKNNIAAIYVSMGKYFEATELLASTITENQLHKDFASLSMNYDNLGDAWGGLHQEDSAVACYHRSQKYITVGFTTESPLELPPFNGSGILDKGQVFTSLSSKAEALYRLYLDQDRDLKYLRAAHRSHEYLDSLIDHIRLNIHSETSQSYLIRRAKPIYEQAIKVCHALWKAEGDSRYLDRAFHYSEKSRSIIQLSAVRGMLARTEILPKESKELDRLQAQMEFYEDRLAWEELNGSEDGNQLSKLRESAVYSRTQYQKNITELQNKNEPYYNLRFNTQTASPRQLREEALAEGQTLLEYFIGDSSAYLFVLRPTGMEMVTLEEPSEFRRLVRRMRNDLLGTQEQSPETVATTHTGTSAPSAGRKLYQLLVAPAGPLSDRLVIVPDAYLGYLPFEALPVAEAPGAAAGETTYFIEQKAISYAPSATLLLEMMQGADRRDPSARWAGFAPVFDQESDPDRHYPLATRGSDRPLAASVQEVEEIGALMGNAPYLRGEATADRVKNEADRYAVLHFSTHGEINDEDPRFNYLSFWDTLLYASDIYQLPRLNADMVVLSACETGLGEVRKGEGIYNLARAFSFAGAGSIVPTLWKVEDQTTARFMKSYYQHLRDGLDKDIALQKTKMAFIKGKEIPFYWAGYVVIGDPSPLRWQAGLPTWVFVLAGGLILLAILAYRRRSAKNN